jgi:hypothetical protein
MSNIEENFQTALEAWSMMQKTEGDEGAEWAERFEQYFYLFIDDLKAWWFLLEKKPKNIDDAEQLPEIQNWMNQLPSPVQLNFITELEELIDGIEMRRYD